MSRPAWARGLKHSLHTSKKMEIVAPCVGAWIETATTVHDSNTPSSRPAWARGLKPLYIVWTPYICGRALRGRVD